MVKSLIAKYDLADCENDFDCEIEFETFLNEIDFEFKKFLEKKVFIEAKNIGWQNLEGKKELTLKDTKQIFYDVIPETQDLSFYLWKTNKNNYLGVCFHHDAPMGENYFYKFN